MAPWKELKEMTLLNKEVTRVDGALKVAGTAIYTYDVQRPGLLYGRILRSIHPHAKVLSVDTSEAEALKGVKAVLGKIKDEVNFVGDDVAAVAAVSEEIAQKALSLIKVEYDVLPFTVREQQAKKEDAPRVFSGRENNLGRSNENSEGDVEKGFQEADAIVEHMYHMNVQVHTPLESHGCVCEWRGDDLYMWDSTQGVHGTRSGMARALEIPENQIHVITHHMGGGFGSKFGPKSYNVVCARLAKKAGVPVKLMLDREEEMLAVGNRPSSWQKIKIGAKSDGTLTAFEMESFGTGGVGGGAGVPQPYIYHFPNWKVKHQDVHINAGAAEPMRAPGHPQANFAMESAMDELAEKLGIDPLEFRIKNDPNETRQQEYKIGAKKCGWDNRKPSGSQTGEKLIGMGVGSGTWGGGGNRRTEAIVNIYPDGAVDVKIGTQDIGVGTWTIVASVLAEELELDLADVKPFIGESDYPWAPNSGGSTTAPSVTPTVKLAAEAAMAKLIELLAEAYETTPDKISYAKKTFTLTESGEKIPWKKACAALDGKAVSEKAQWGEGLSSSGTAGCQFAEVEVDAETGRVKVKRLVAVQDCGLVVNMLTARSQVNGAIIGEIGYVLFENRLLDNDTGIMQNADLENYKIPGALEMPEFDVTFYDEHERGVIGLGEPPAIPGVGAIANAVANAIGVRFYELPITPDRVLLAIDKRKEGTS
ncbi:xanthine dehydrogenase family protein molybdopterin-binding subunit [candidate division KSB1 bacterium]|nr:xanthine dehydrogenase family protein molybdopterin-binding subunit [candidate division KSB1 bacterium]RQW00850.1 MAG: xanthine dehydrogenase family protein molybdopterin-binding subunit [candidate division KSB1 bacterium]